VKVHIERLYIDKIKRGTSTLKTEIL